jgi:hypothetical protein
MTLDTPRPFWPSGAKRIALVSIPDDDQLIAYGIDLDRHRLVFWTELPVGERTNLVDSLCDGYAAANAQDSTDGGDTATPPPADGAPNERAVPIDQPVVVIPGTGPQGPGPTVADPPPGAAETARTATIDDPGAVAPGPGHGGQPHLGAARRAAERPRAGRVRRPANKPHPMTAARRLTKKARASR